MLSTHFTTREILQFSEVQIEGRLFDVFEQHHTSYSEVIILS
jgi:hypothetical protein